MLYQTWLCLWINVADFRMTYWDSERVKKGDEIEVKGKKKSLKSHYTVIPNYFDING